MMFFLQNFEKANEVILYDADSGRIVSTNNSKDVDEEINGMLIKTSEDSAVVLIHEKPPVFQDSLERWNLSKVRCICFRWFQKQRFFIFDGFTLVYSRTYSSSAKPLFDPTHDDIDETSLYFFKLVCSINRRERRRCNEL